jgi:hypothetical protein
LNSAESLQPHGKLSYPVNYFTQAPSTVLGSVCKIKATAVSPRESVSSEVAGRRLLVAMHLCCLRRAEALLALLLMAAMRYDRLYLFPRQSGADAVFVEALFPEGTRAQRRFTAFEKWSTSTTVLVYSEGGDQSAAHAEDRAYRPSVAGALTTASSLRSRPRLRLPPGAPLRRQWRGCCPRLW